MCCVFQDTDTLWLDYHQNITDKSVNAMDTYLAQFPDIKVCMFLSVVVTRMTSNNIIAYNSFH